MPLPKIQVPTYQVTIPSTNNTITVRPFLVKEEKVLLTALQGGETEDVANATKQIVSNCILSKEVDVDKLEIFDFEYLILQLRILSVGDSATIRFLPVQESTCPECSKEREVKINLRDAKVENITETKKKVKINDNIGLGLKYPTAKVFSLIELARTKNDLDSIFKLVWSCVDYVYDQDTIISSKDVSVKEGLEFLESLSNEQFKEIETFLSSIPKLQQKIHVKCSQCTFEQDYILSGLDDFFA